MVNKVEMIFARFARTMGKKIGGYTKLKNGKFKANVGNWTLSYNPTYGGYVIEQIYNAGGGVSQPFGSQRHKPTQFITMMRFAMDAIDIKRRRR